MRTRPPGCRSAAAAILLAVVLFQPARGWAAEAPPSRAPALYMGADALIARPILLAITMVGAVVYVASLPFSLIGGNADQAAEVLFAGPARATFTRCLGCTGEAASSDSSH